VQTGSNYYFSRGPSCSQFFFVPKFIAMATKVGMGKILTTPSDSPNPKIVVSANSAQLSFMGTQLYRFDIPIGRNANLKKNGVN